ncbi:MAG TPA: tetratricopeptide repeat protein, partial [Planctomycetota bacterium]|nr:tetratricopeptide repeat protein [Planctomycetota bacterium]
DLLLRNRNGPQVRILKNVWPDPGRAIWIRCEGRASNRSGIGARVTLHTPRGPRMKETCAGSLFLSQSSPWLCFGLGKEPPGVAESFRAEVRWPGGRVEDLGPLLPGRRYRVREGEGAAAEPIHEATGTRRASLPAPEPAAGGLSSRATGHGAHSSPATWLIEPIPAPPFALPAAGAPPDDSRRYGPRLNAEAPLFLHFVSISCPVCIAGCEETRAAEKLCLEAGAGFLHVIVDAGSSPEDIRAFLARARYASPAVVADSRLLTAYNVVHRHLWNLRRDLAVPSTMLLDRGGSIVMAHRGPLAAREAVAYARSVPVTRAERLALAFPFPGTLQHDTFHRDLLVLGNAFFEAGLADLARDTFQAGLKRGAGTSGEVDLADRPQTVDADLLYNYALACADSGRREEAEAAYRRVLDLAPAMDDARNNLGVLLAREGRLDEAAAAFRSILDRNPAHSEAALNLSNSLLEGGRSADAVDVLTRALASDPESAPFHRQRGYALYRDGDLDGAIQSQRAALKIDPLDTESELGLAILLIARGDALEAREVSERALARSPSHAGLLNTLGMAHADLGNDNEAVSALEKAIEASPSFDRPYTNLARVHLARTRLSEAEQVLRRLLEVSPGHTAAAAMLKEMSTAPSVEAAR